MARQAIRLVIRGRVQGYQLSLPFGRVEAAERFLEALRGFLPADALPAARPAPGAAEAPA